MLFGATGTTDGNAAEGHVRTGGAMASEDNDPVVEIGHCVPPPFARQLLEVPVL